VDEIESGNIRALIVTGGNPLRAVPGSRRLADAFTTLEVLAVADVLATATVESATHVLACAAQFERPDVALVETMYPVPASQYTPALVPPRGDTRQLFELLSGLGGRLGLAPAAPDAERLFDVLAGSKSDALRTERMMVGDPEIGWFTDEIVPDGRWSLAPDRLVERLTEALVALEPSGGTLLLTPRRQIGHMNTLLAGRSDRPELLVSETDAAALGLGDGTLVEVRADSSAVVAAVRVDIGMRQGVVSLPHG
jgi:anaerobic selenocysteine-containing dehydrogenase